VNCGSLPNTWRYTGIEMAQGLPVEATSHKISIDSTTGAIMVV
jgi:hypothetical protein